MTGSGGAADANISHASQGGARRRGQGPGGRTRRSVFLRPHFPQPASFARRTPSVWLQGLGRGWFLLRRKRVVNRPTVTVTGIVDADPNALPGPRHDGEAGLSAPARPQPPRPAARRPPSLPVPRGSVLLPHPSPVLITQPQRGETPAPQGQSQLPAMARVAGAVPRLVRG